MRILHKHLLARIMSALILCVMTVGAGSALAGSGPVLDLGFPEIRQGQVVLDVQLSGFFRKETLRSLESGAPATLVFQWRLRQELPGRRDRVVTEGEVRNRIFFDVLEEQYHLFNHLGRPLGACTALSGLTEVLCNRDAMVLTRAKGLLAGGRYYIEMEVTLEVLSDEQVRGFEDWLLSGDDSRSSSLEEEVEQNAGLSQVLLGVVKKLAGISATSARDESPVFSGEEVAD